MDSDISAASAWVHKLPNGEIRDCSISTIADHLSYNSAASSAIAWATAISDSQKRMIAIENTVNQWKLQDATAAHAWVASSNLPEENKNRLLKQISSGK